MRFLSIAAAGIVALIPHIAVADCIGLFNEPEPGYRLRPSGHIDKTEEMVTAGTKMKFKGIGLLNNKSYLARSQSDLVYDAYNIELISNCSLPLGRSDQALSLAAVGHVTRTTADAYKIDARRVRRLFHRLGRMGQVISPRAISAARRMASMASL